MAFLNPHKQQRAREAARKDRRARDRAALCTSLQLPVTATGVEVAAATLARIAERRGRDQAAREATYGVLVELAGGVVCLYRRAALAPNSARIRSMPALDAALRRAREVRVVGIHGTSAAMTSSSLRAIAAPLFDRRAA